MRGGGSRVDSREEKALVSWMNHNTCEIVGLEEGIVMLWDPATTKLIPLPSTVSLCFTNHAREVILALLDEYIQPFLRKKDLVSAWIVRLAEARLSFWFG